MAKNIRESGASGKIPMKAIKAMKVKARNRAAIGVMTATAMKGARARAMKAMKSMKTRARAMSKVQVGCIAREGGRRNREFENGYEAGWDAAMESIRANKGECLRWHMRRRGELEVVSH